MPLFSQKGNEKVSLREQLEKVKPWFLRAVDPGTFFFLRTLSRQVRRTDLSSADRVPSRAERADT